MKIVGVLLILLVIYLGYLFFKYNEDLPEGIEGLQADSLALEMQRSLNIDAFQSTDYLEWTFRNTNRYKWDKKSKKCEVIWDDYKVDLDLSDYSQSKAFVHNFRVQGEQAEELIDDAISYFNNDSFWLIAPFKTFDPGVKRFLVNHEGKNALLVTYTQGGTTPGDSYLWLFDETGKPKAYKMWTSILPFKGIPATWENWQTTSTGVLLPGSHKLLFFTIEMGNIITR